MLKELPKKVTKKILFELYKPLPERTIRSFVNDFIVILGKSPRIRIVPELVQLYFFKKFGLPENYKLSDELQKKMEKLNSFKC
jgi:hypothetical protein